MGDKSQKRLSSLLIVATFVVLQIPLKRLIRELVPGRRGPGDDIAEALVQGAARATAVILVSALIRGLAGDQGPSTDRAGQEDPSIKEGALEATLDLQ